MILDYSLARPGTDAMKLAGVTAVMRYLSFTPSKNLTPAERDVLLAAGLGIGLVWETTATRAGQGYAAGQADARAAEGQADALAYPAGCPIFYAVDYAATPAQVAPYFQGVASAAVHPVGVYGSASVVEGVPAPWKWQTTAWSGGRVSPAAHLYQTTETPPVPGTDVNHVRRPFPLWTTAGVATASEVINLPGAPLPAAPGPLTVTPPALAAQEDDMATPLIWRRNDGAAMILTAEGPQALTFDQWQVWVNLLGDGAGNITPKGMYAMDPGPFAAVTASLTLDHTAAIAAAVLAALPNTGNPLTADQITAAVKTGLSGLTLKAQ